jgi:hypothetical protein
VDDSKTLEELDGQRWDEPDEDASGLVKECHRLRRVPLRTLTNDEVRLLLGQKIGPEWLVSVAVTRLLEEPLAGDLYPGDLLSAVLRTDASHWERHPEDAMSLAGVRVAWSRFMRKRRSFLHTRAGLESPLDSAASTRAGSAWRSYRLRDGRRERLIADFLVGAHAVEQADRLLTRDRGFHKGAFGSLVVVDPSA